MVFRNVISKPAHEVFATVLIRLYRDILISRHERPVKYPVQELNKALFVRKSARRMKFLFVHCKRSEFEIDFLKIAQYTNSSFIVRLARFYFSVPIVFLPQRVNNGR